MLPLHRQSILSPCPAVTQFLALPTNPSKIHLRTPSLPCPAVFLGPGTPPGMEKHPTEPSAAAEPRTILGIDPPCPPMPPIEAIKRP